MIRILTIAFFILLIFSQIYGWAVGTGPVFKENRILKSAPDVTADALLKKEFYFDMEEAFNDNFFFRSRLIRLKSYIDYHVFNTSANDEISIGRDGWLFMKQNTFMYRIGNCTITKEIDEVAWRLKTLEHMLRKKGKRLIIVTAPSKHLLYPEYTGVDYNEAGIKCGKYLYTLFLETLEREGIEEIVRLEDALRAKKDEGLYFSTDTHWNIKGAKIAAGAVFEKLAPGRKLLPDLEFTSTKENGNLAHMLGLDLGGKLDYQLPEEYLKRIKETPLDDIKDRRSSFTITSQMKDTTDLLPDTVIFHDSFLADPLLFLKTSFRRLDLLWTYDLTSKESLEAMGKADIVIVEVVDNNILALEIDVDAAFRAFSKASSKK